ncbi:MlaA family lipoprotein [Amaricoccus solimangrovi]|nr:VacJ family lipoprotein [Amaricoccus solimangrovi]
MLSPLGGLFLLGACATPPSGDPNDLSWDPLEPYNRPVHETNVELDAQVIGPVARAYGNTVPQVARNGIRNVRDNWKLPGEIIQYGLQGNGLRVAQSTTRFAVNTLLGLGGVLDIAKDMGLPYRETGFDETFYQWGIPDGGYLVMPVFGPGTQRDWTAWALDQFADPTYYVLSGPVVNGLLVVSGLDIVNDRYELDPIVDQLLHNSADSYTATRVSYLQNKRARLSEGEGNSDLDMLEDVYANQ